MSQKLAFADDHFHDECGVFGVFGHPEASNLAYLGLYALQHRGQESAGIVSSDGRELYVHRAMGEVEEIFQPSVLARLPGSLAIGHTRYSTAGDKALLNAQPIMIDCNKGKVAHGHNGNLTNAAEWRHKLEHRGSIFQTNSDTEVIVHLLARSQTHNLSGALGDALNQVEGAYSLLVLTTDELYAVRDPRGFRPLVLGKLLTPGGHTAWLVASETCAFDLLNAQYLREIEPGEMVRISKCGIESIHFAPAKRHQQPQNRPHGPRIRSQRSPRAHQLPAHDFALLLRRGHAYARRVDCLFKFSRGNLQIPRRGFPRLSLASFLEAGRL